MKNTTNTLLLLLLMAVCLHADTNTPPRVPVGSPLAKFGSDNLAKLLKNTSPKFPNTAPIIESGRTVAILTNTTAHLTKFVTVPLFCYDPRSSDGPPIRHDDFSLEGMIQQKIVVGDNLPEWKTFHTTNGIVKILKVEDDTATVVSTDTHWTTPAFQIPYQWVKELKGMPHLTDGNTNWITEEETLKNLEDVRTKYKTYFQEGRHQNWRNIPWKHSDIGQWQRLNVPLCSENPTGDNSAIVAVANALNYLYTRETGNPTQVSKTFLTWAHDTFPIQDTNKEWKPDDHINPTNLTEGEFPSIYTSPERFEVPITSGQEHQIDLGQLLKAIQHFGIALEEELPSQAKLLPPQQDIQAAAKNRVENKPFTIRCFHSWNAPYPHLERYTQQGATPTEEDNTNYRKEEGAYEAQTVAFINNEVSKGHPVLITNVHEIGNTGTYTKKTFVVTATNHPKDHQSWEVLTPSGHFETHKYLGDNIPFYGEFIDPQILRPGESFNPFGQLIRMRAIITEVKLNHNPSWKNVKYRSWYAQGTDNKWTSPKFEVYSLGFD